LLLPAVDGLDFVGDLQATILDIDGKVRTEQGTQPTVDAVGAGGEFGGMIALGIRAMGHDEHTLGAELDTKTAALAPFLNDLNDAMGHANAIPIQWLTPVGHSPSSVLH
jgi:hypothetical protein